MSEQSLLLMRLDALYTRCGDRMARANEPWGEGVPAPLLLVGRTLRGETVWRFGMQAEPGFTCRAQALLSRGAWDPVAVPDALGLRRCVHEVCLYHPGGAPSPAGCRLLTPRDAALLAETFPEEVEELPTATPFVARLLDGRIVCVCRSVRKGGAYEAGIETLASCRRQGHALRALSAWTAEVLRLGVVPLYAAHADNAPSLSLAQKAGYIPYAHTFEYFCD